MKRKKGVILAGLVFLLAVNSCSTQLKDEVQDFRKSLTYSNLVDVASRTETRKTMESAGISAENIDSFFEEVNDFNQIIEEKSLVETGFKTIESLEPDYDLVAMQTMWDAKYPSFIGYNCRLTTFDLIKNKILIGKVKTENADWLIFDKNAIENNPKNLFSLEEYEKFETLYSFIPTENTTDIMAHVKNIQDSWQDQEITFPNKEELSIISVFFHDEEGYLFIGHTGILLPTKEGKLLFVEKLSFHQPYQAIKFGDRLELNDYLMNKYDISWDQETAKPFIMENNELLEGYREKPNNVKDDSSS